MKSKYISIQSFRSIILILLALVLNVTVSFAQTNTLTKIKDGSVLGNTSATAAPYSILELESATKGFLLPRMTTAERNKIIITDKERGQGLVIYNTDDDCLNYWHKEKDKWMSICGTLPPAKIDIDCSKVYLNASGSTELKQGVSLKDTDILLLSVNVLETGSYSISAVTTNGYSFNKSGVFETTGIYTIGLEGFGTPLVENPTLGDALSLRINGKEDSKCTAITVKVKSSAVDYNVSGFSTPAWKTYKGVPLNSTDNVVRLTLNVHTVGVWRITSENTVNGMSFSGSGEFKNTGPSQVITLYGQGTPAVASSSAFRFVTNAATAFYKKPDFSINIETVGSTFDLVCNDAVNKVSYRGEYNEDYLLTKSNSITVPIKVTGPGVVDLELLASFSDGIKNIAPVKFTAPNSVLNFNSKTNDIQMITFYPESKIIPIKSKEIVFSSFTPNPKGATLCTDFPRILVTQRNKNYTINCGNSYPFSNRINAKGGYFTVKSPLVSGNQGIVVEVNVGYAENYKIKTNTQNGVYYEKVGAFTDIEREQGTAKIILEPKGAPSYTNPGSYMYSLSTEGLSKEIVSACTLPIVVQGRTFNVLGVGINTYAPTGNGNNTYAADAIMQNTNLFGPEGKVKIGGFKVFTNWMVNEFPADLENYLVINKIDIIILAYKGFYKYDEMMVLLDFIQNKKGVVILADEMNMNMTPPPGSVYTSSSNLLIAKLMGKTQVQANTGIVYGSTKVNTIIGPSADPIITTTEFGSLTGKHIGNSYPSKGWYVPMTDITSDYIPLAVSKSQPNKVAMFRHKTLGFIFMGNGDNFGGTIGSTSTDSFPVKYDSSGTLGSKEYSYDGSVYNVYNSILYANILKWAVDYVSANKQ